MIEIGQIIAEFDHRPGTETETSGASETFAFKACPFPPPTHAGMAGGSTLAVMCAPARRRPSFHRQSEEMRVGASR